MLNSYFLYIYVFIYRYLIEWTQIIFIHFLRLQWLPPPFCEKFYTGSKWLYLMHNRGTKHKVWIKPVNSSCNILKFYGAGWAEFVRTSKYTDPSILHFMNLEKDMYYVTGYDKDGFECGGYNNAVIGSRQKRCFLYMDNNLAHSPVSSHSIHSYLLHLNYMITSSNMYIANLITY